jgi:hypothetical protein
MISGATNTGSGGNSAVNGFFPVTTYTNSQNFTMTVPTPPGSGTITPGVLNYGDAVMQKFINNGGTGSVPRPEITGRDWQALSFFIRRSTTAGSYPGPVALPAPNPSTPYDQTAPPQISNVVATQLSHTSIRVTWTTDQSTIGLACAGTAALIGKQYTYSVYSPLESGYGTSHNVVITQVPDTIAGPSTGAIHFCVLSKNVEGTSSYSPDQTITITP